MDPNMFGTNKQWRDFFVFVAVVIVLLIGLAFGLGAWIF